MLDMELKWEDAVKNAEHYKAIGAERIWLGRDQERPWELVTSCTAGGSYRMGISTGIDFIAKHPSGLEFQWTLYLEKPSANGRSEFLFDHDPITQVIGKLRGPALQQFKEILCNVAASVQEQASKYLDYYKKHISGAEFLKGITR